MPKQPKQPSEPRHTVERFPGGVRVVLPSAKKFFRIIFLGFIVPYSLAFVAMVGYFIGSLILASWGDLTDSPDLVTILVPGLFFIIFFSITLMISGMAIYSFLWQIKGREIIEVKKNDTLSVCRQIFNWRPTEEYVVKEIKDLRAVEQTYSIRHTQSEFWRKLRHKSGSIAFDYGAKTYHFAEEIDPAEAKMIIAVLQEYLPG